MGNILEELNVVYEDNHVIVVIKPQNIPTQEDETKDKDMLSMVKEYIKTKYEKPGNVYVGLVHRLDRPTGGLLVFAKTSKAASRLSEQMTKGDFDKRYLTVVCGYLKNSTGKLEHYLRKDEKTNTVKIVPQSSVGAKKAELIYRVLGVAKQETDKMEHRRERTRIKEYEEINNQEAQEEVKFDKVFDKFSLTEIQLLTGRSHQIRVQMSSQKTPVYGDVKYGWENELSQQNSSKLQMTDTLALWAYSLSFIHPTTKQKMTFTSLPPKEVYPWSLFDLERMIKG